MKNVIFAVFQFVVFFVVFGAGSLFPPFKIERVIAVTAGSTRIFVWDGLLLALALAIIILVIEAMRGRIRRAGPWTSAAFVLATIAGLALKFGFLTRER